MKEKTPQHEHIAREHKDAKSIAALSGQLAPPEETLEKSTPNRPARKDLSGGLLDADSFKASGDYVDSDQANRGLFGLEPVIVVIFILLVAFIAFIAYLVSLMPAPVK